MDSFEQSKEQIQEILFAAEEAIKPRIAPVRELLVEIKQALAHGTDKISTNIFQDWAVTLGIYSSELTAYKEAYSLASALWKIDINNSNAKSLAERRAEQKKVDIENQNVIDSKDKETQKVIIDYMKSMLQETKNDISTMLSELNRILDARNWNREVKGGE